MEKSILAAVLKGMLFEQLEPRRAAELLQSLLEAGEAEQEEYSKGEVIYSPVCYRKSLGILLEGRAVVEKSGGVFLRVLEEGECFGAAALFAENTRYVTTIRGETPCKILFLSAAGMNRLFLEEPIISRRYITFLSGRIQFLNHKIDSFAAPTAEQSLLCYLENLPAIDVEAGQMVSLPLPLAKLAETLNLGRSSLYRALEGLETQGVLRRSGKKIYLSKPK